MAERVEPTLRMNAQNEKLLEWHDQYYALLLREVAAGKRGAMHIDALLLHGQGLTPAQACARVVDAGRSMRMVGWLRWAETGMAVAAGVVLGMHSRGAGISDLATWLGAGGLLLATLASIYAGRRMLVRVEAVAA